MKKKLPPQNQTARTPRGNMNPDLNISNQPLQYSNKNLLQHHGSLATPESPIAGTKLTGSLVRRHPGARTDALACCHPRRARRRPRAPPVGLATSPTEASRGGAGRRRAVHVESVCVRVLPSPPPYSSYRRPSRRSGSSPEGSANFDVLWGGRRAVRFVFMFMQKRA